MKSSTQRPWYGHLRLSVRGLIVLALIAGGGFGSVVRNARIQQSAVVALKRHGNGVVYNHHLSNSRTPHVWGLKIPTWLVDRVGVD